MSINQQPDFSISSGINLLHGLFAAFVLAMIVGLFGYPLHLAASSTSTDSLYNVSNSAFSAAACIIIIWMMTIGTSAIRTMVVATLATSFLIAMTYLFSLCR